MRSGKRRRTVGEKRGRVTGDTFVYAARVTPANGRGRTVAVAFIPTVVPSGASLGNQLRDFFRTNPLSAELWLVGPSFATDALREVRASVPFHERLAHASTLDALRLITFDALGTWTEIDGAPDTSDFITDDVVTSVRSAGLRIMFREGHGLSEAPAGLHYAKPSGAHTQFFLRAGPVVARSPLAYFVAAALLPWASARTHDRIWVDTGAIAGVGYALAALQGKFEGTPQMVPVDSFGGYERLATNPPYPGEQPLVLISASTSGGLARHISDTYGIAEDDVLTLFYVGNDPNIVALCDLTRRAPEDDDEYKIDPITSWSQSCPLCEDGLTAIRLEGEDFVPEAARATSRMLRSAHASVNMKRFVRDFYGTGAIQIARTTDAQSGHARTMSVQLGALLLDEKSSVHARVIRELRLRLPAQARWIVTLGDPDSNAVAELARQVCIEAGIETVEIVGTSELDSGRMLGGGHAFVVAGTVASGRALLNVSRQLRYLHDDHIHYFVVCGRPRSKAAWLSLAGDLRYGERAGEYPLSNVWMVETEPDRGEENPWLLETSTLQQVHSALTGSSAAQDGSLAAVRARLKELQVEFLLFVASDYGAAETSLELNPNFAFWDFAYDAIGSASHDEVFFTMATVMHAFRYSVEGRYALFSVPGHSYVLDPLNFGRFNDPVIQASILRVATGGELDYRNHSETSRLMTDEILHLFAHHDDTGFGGAAAEFALSLARGLSDLQSSGALRLHRTDLDRFVQKTANISPEHAPLLSALTRYIAMQVAPKDN
jgi:hypothetical protein